MIGAAGRFLSGEVRFFFRTAPHAAANLFLRSGVPVYDVEICGEGCAATVERRDRKAVFALCAREGIEAEILWEKGLLPFLAAAGKRPGILAGILSALLLVWQASSYVWDLKISGNERLTDEEVEAILRGAGFSVGCRHRSVDLHDLCNRIPLDSDEIAWISVNMMGSVAEICVVENRKRPEQTEETARLVNLVAAREGQIVRYELSSGRATVSVGQTVSPGQLLAAGFSEKETGLHPRVCVGKVYAKTRIDKSVFIPFVYEEEIRGAPVTLSKSIFFSGKEVFFYKNGRHNAAKYDIVKEEYRPEVFGVSLPVTVRVAAAVPRTVVKRLRSAEEAKALAAETLLSAYASEGAQLTERRFFYTENKLGVYAVCRAECILDIAVKAPVQIENPPERNQNG